ncbi:hypothetical protein QUA43_24630 [Microcoleus sp. N9_B4]|uniref:hypothetical protein n=1 Tax=Microcoleus sp. N9_B4 TaxID=3055386 RepID=UPI002FCEAA3D
MGGWAETGFLRDTLLRWEDLGKNPVSLIVREYRSGADSSDIFKCDRTSDRSAPYKILFNCRSTIVFELKT